MRLPCAILAAAAVLWFWRPAAAVTIQGLVLGTSANESTCSIPRPVSSVRSSDSQILVRFQARAVKAGDEVRVEWVAPDGGLASSAAYEGLPAAPELCLLAALPVGGLEPAVQPGLWQVRVVANGREALRRQFRITQDTVAGGVRVNSAALEETGEGLPGRLRILGSGFEGESVAHVAAYRPAGGWSYVAAALPESITQTAMLVRIPVLEAGEYLLIVRNPDGASSAPVRFLVAAGGGYRLPVAGETEAHITQGPYGSFSHFGRSLHAYDIKAEPSACVVSMQAGTVYAFDLKLKQTPTRRIFGNYITIRHDNGEFSHYGHLATGTFLVGSGERVEQGQPLARMGNSGYALGAGGGRHVHVHVTKSFPIGSASIPFRFEELPLAPRRGFRGVVVSANRQGPQSCGAAPAARPEQASVGLAEWYHRSVAVPKGSKQLEVVLGWEGDPAALNLAVVSPSGREYGAYGLETGYSGAAARPESVTIANPEPGSWRVSVHGVRGSGEPIGFQLSVSPQGRP